MTDSTPIITIPADTVLHCISPERPALPADAPEAVVHVMNRLATWDPATADHCGRVGELCEAFGRFLGLNEHELGVLTLATHVHDAGKLQVDADILTKEGKLTDGEYDTIKNHSQWGEEILRDAGLDEEVLDIIRSHHERWDGRGYPDQLCSSEIPLAARIIAVVDTLDAMSARRSYHRRRTNFLALAEIRRCAGSQFDPDVASAFIDFMCQRLAEDRRVA